MKSMAPAATSCRPNVMATNTGTDESNWTKRSSKLTDLVLLYRCLNSAKPTIHQLWAFVVDQALQSPVYWPFSWFSLQHPCGCVWIWAFQLSLEWSGWWLVVGFCCSLLLFQQLLSCPIVEQDTPRTWQVFWSDVLISFGIFCAFDEWWWDTCLYVSFSLNLSNGDHQTNVPFRQLSTVFWWLWNSGWLSMVHRHGSHLHHVQWDRTILGCVLGHYQPIVGQLIYTWMLLDAALQSVQQTILLALSQVSLALYSASSSIMLLAWATASSMIWLRAGTLTKLSTCQKSGGNDTLMLCSFCNKLPEQQK